MTRIEYARDMASLASHLASDAADAADMARTAGDDSEVSLKHVTKTCEEIRLRLLFIERAAHGIK